MSWWWILCWKFCLKYKKYIFNICCILYTSLFSYYADTSIFPSDKKVVKFSHIVNRENKFSFHPFHYNYLISPQSLLETSATLSWVYVGWLGVDGIADDGNYTLVLYHSQELQVADKSPTETRSFSCHPLNSLKSALVSGLKS